MKNEDSSINALTKRWFNTKKSTVNFELSFNYGKHQTIESKDDTLCMYDYAKEILELMEEELDG